MSDKFEPFYGGLPPKQYDYIEKIKNLNLEKTEKTGRPVYCLTHTYGCQQNENDTEKINGMLLQMGYVLTEDKSLADLILFNTCAVREHAEQKVFGNVGALVGYKRQNASLKIALCGCMFQQKHITEKVSAYKHVDLIFGTHALSRFPENLYKTIIAPPGQKVIDISENNGKTSDTRISVETSEFSGKEDEIFFSDEFPVKRSSDLKAYVTIMSGCNNFCSYCVVPYVRGREHSRSPESVMKEVNALVKNGYKEIMLLGQNVNSYCKDIGIDYDFSDLLQDINSISGNFRIRFMTSHPKDASRKLFDTIAGCEKVCSHIHLPFQSGSDRILGLMNRRYTADEYKKLVEYARSVIPDVTFTSDVIVGFPTEAEEDFEATLKLVSDIGFNGLFTFLYSPRKNTPAAEMEGQISKEVKAERFQRLIDLQNGSSRQQNSVYIGKTVTVLTEGSVEGKDGIMTGRTDNNIIVNFPAGKELSGRYADIKIESVQNWAMNGIMVSSEE